MKIVSLVILTNNLCIEFREELGDISGFDKVFTMRRGEFLKIDANNFREIEFKK